MNEEAKRFRSVATVEKPDRLLNHQDRFVLLGSCFADQIGKRLEQSLFHTATNPLGTTYNPLSIAASIERSLRGELFSAEDFFQTEEYWASFDVHSSLAKQDRDSSIEAANTGLNRLKQALLEASVLSITMGTAWVYQYKKTQQIVAHNHRQNLADFDKRLISPEEISNAITATWRSLKQVNPKLEIHLTISPVRHLRDGLHQNNLSKSSLFLALEKLRTQGIPFYYFPAFELIQDELRDYRFYAEDMAHPSDQAVDYVWERYRNSCLSREAIEISREAKDILTGLKHRPRNPESKTHRQFLQSLSDRAMRLRNMDLNTEILFHELAKQYG